MSQLSPPPTKSTTLLSDKLYNILKHVAAIFLPAAAALYYGLAQIWHFSHPGQIMATIAVINTFIGALVGVSNIQYNNSSAKYAGTLEVLETPTTKTYSLNLNTDPNELDQLSEVTLKVSPTLPADESSVGNNPISGS